MNETNYHYNDGPNESNFSIEYEIIKLRKLLKRVMRLIRHRCKIRNRVNKIISKLMLKQVQLTELKQKSEGRIEKLKERKKAVRKEIRERQRIKALVRKRRLERLKLMSQFKKSLRKAYLKELKSEKARKKRLKKHSKRVHPVIRKINAKILELLDKLELLGRKLEKLTSKIEKARKKKNSLGIRILKLKAKRIRIQLIQLLNPDYKFEETPTVIQYKEMPDKKIVEFHSENKSEFLPIPKRTQSIIKTINEPEPIGDKQSDARTKDFSHYKKKIFIKRRKKTKIKEPLPIGDKRDVEETTEIKRKRKRFFRRSRRHLTSDSEQKTLTSDSDANGDRSAQPKKRVLHRKKLHKRRTSTDGSSTEPITSLKTSTTDNDSENLAKVKTSMNRNSVNVKTMRKQFSFKPDLIDKPAVKRRTAMAINLPERRTTEQLKEIQPRIRFSKFYGKPLDVYDENYYKNLVKTHRMSIREKIKSERKKTLLEQQKIQEQKQAAQLERESMERRAHIRKSRQTLADIDPLEKLVLRGLQSNFFSTDFIPSQTAVVDDEILQIASKIKGVRSFFQSKHKISEEPSSESEIGNDAKTNHGGKSKNQQQQLQLQRKKSVQISDRPLFDRKPASAEENVDSDEETLLRVSDLWDYEYAAQDLLTKLIEKNQKPKIPPKPKRTKKKKLIEIKPQSAMSHSPSEGEVNVEHVLKPICSACGMTDLTQGGFCCPLKPKKQ